MPLIINNVINLHMKTSDIGVAAIIYGIATWFLVMTLQLPEDAQTYPLILICALYLCNTLFIGRKIWDWLKTRSYHDDLPDIFKGFIAKQFFGVVAGCIAYLACFNFLGFYVASVLYLLLAQFALKVKPLTAVISCVCVMVTTYLVFSLFLKVPLPAGIFFGA